MIGKRTGNDFTDYTVEIVKQEGLLIHKLRKPDYNKCYSIDFTNVNGVLLITGDYGNWIACREFHPSKEGSVSDEYWMEKMRTYSTQVLSKYDDEETKKELKELLTNEEEPLTEDEVEYINDLIDCCEDKLDYTYAIYREQGVGRFKNWDYEYKPFCKKHNVWLDIIFDAFEELCDRYKQGLLTG